MVEKNGISITSLLQRSNPMKERNCRREDCFVCTSKGKSDCSRNNIVYEIKCNNCNSKYCGETARNAYTRGKEHMKLLHDKEQNSPLWSHCLKEHNGHIQQFTMNVVNFSPRLNDDTNNRSNTYQKNPRKKEHERERRMEYRVFTTRKN